MKRYFPVLWIFTTVLLVPGCASMTQTEKVIRTGVPSAIELNDEKELTSNEVAVDRLGYLLTYERSALQDKALEYLKSDAVVLESLGPYLQSNPDARGFLIKKIFSEERLKQRFLTWLSNDKELLQEAMALIQ